MQGGLLMWLAAACGAAACCSLWWQQQQSALSQARSLLWLRADCAHGPDLDLDASSAIALFFFCMPLAYFPPLSNTNVQCASRRKALTALKEGSRQRSAGQLPHHCPLSCPQHTFYSSTTTPDAPRVPGWLGVTLIAFFRAPAL